MKFLQSARIVFIGAAFTYLGACGGGGGGGSSSGSTTTSVVSSGTITGFGSIFLNGVRFDTTNASFKVDGESATQAELHAGEVVTIHGHRGADGKSVADSVTFDDAVRGPVVSVDATNGQLVVLGQTVLVNADTSFGDNIPSKSIAELAVNDVIEVSGMRRADGSIVATRIERAAAGASFQVVGAASSVDTATRKFMIGTLTVDYSAAAVRGFPSGQPSNGDVVEVRGSNVSSMGVLLATSIEGKDDDNRLVHGDENEIEGIITRFASATDFDVAGHAVTTTDSTRFVNGAAADLAADVKVEIEGQTNSSGVLVASKIELRRAANSRIEAMVDSVDTTAGKFTVLGVPVTVVAGMTRVEDKEDAPLQMFNLSNLQVGDFVDVRGVESPAGSNQLVATRFEREGARNQVRLRGVVDSVAAPSLSILGVTIQTNGTTTFGGNDGPALTADTFFAMAQGQVVSVKGTFSGGVFTATEVSLGDD